MDHPIILANRERDLYFVEESFGTKRIVFVPKNWADELRYDGDDADPSGEFTCYYGNDDVLAYQSNNGVYESTDCTQCYSCKILAEMQEVTEADARQIDPALFMLLDAINAGEAV